MRISQNCRNLTSKDLDFLLNMVIRNNLLFIDDEKVKHSDYLFVFI